MESYDDIYKTICRVCLSYGNKEKMEYLTDNNSDDGLTCFGKSVVIFANISIKLDDHLPNMMCLNCVKLLKQAIHFKLKCESSDKKLNEVLKSRKHYEELGTFKEAIVQCIMFTQNFPDECNSKRNTISSREREKSQTPAQCIVVDTFNDYDTSFEDNNDNESVNQEQDSADETLNAMEKMIGWYPKLLSPDHKKYVRDKVIQQQRFKAKKKPCEDVSLAQLTYFNNKSTQMKGKAVEDKYTCKVCNKDYSNRNTYKYHLQRHNGYKYICEHCGKGFAVLADLQMHQLARHGTGPHLKCHYCNFKAPKKFVLTEHERIHTGERPYTCDKCGLTFRRRAIWKKHLIYHSEKTTQCPQCPRKFFTKAHMFAHFNNMHERMYVYSCHKCDMTYAKTSSVRRHLTEKHGIPREMQGRIIRINKGRVTFPEQ